MAARILDSEAVVEYRRGDLLISTNRERLNLDVVHGFLTNCYWANGIPREVVARSIDHALCFGIYDGQGAQIGFVIHIHFQAFVSTHDDFCGGVFGFTAVFGEAVWAEVRGEERGRCAENGVGAGAVA